MAYPYKKMTSEDFDYIRSVTASDRVWVGDEIAKEYYRDEMPEYGVFPPELYVEVVNKEEISAIMAYAYKENIPVVCRGAGTGLAGGATCKYGGIMLSVMRMNKIFPIDRRTRPSQLSREHFSSIFRRQQQQADFFIRRTRAKKQHPSAAMLSQMPVA